LSAATMKTYLASTNRRYFCVATRTGMFRLR
jgi:hypothetical protein